MFKELMKYISLSLIFLLSSKIYSEFIVLECSKLNNWTDKRDKKKAKEVEVKKQREEKKKQRGHT